MHIVNDKNYYYKEVKDAIKKGHKIYIVGGG